MTAQADALHEQAETLERLAEVVARVADALNATAGAVRAVSVPAGAFTLEETANRLGVSPGYVRKLIEGGRLEALQHEPGVWRVEADALARYRRRLEVAARKGTP